MKIQYLNGGLANQVFQYIFARFAQLYNPQQEPWLIDDSFFFVQNVHNGYELEKVFGIHANLLSNTLDKDVWQELIRGKQAGTSIPQSFIEFGIDMQMIAETSNYKEHNPFNGIVHPVPANDFIPEITRLPFSNIYYHGYWINNKWFQSYENIFRKELTFSPITDSLNYNYANLITTTNSIGVHIRRGDYVTIGWSLQTDYYLQSMNTLVQKYPEATFFVFSDDLDWCKEHSDELGFSLAKHIIYVEGNMHGQNFRDLQLMSMCKGLLMSNSAFCFLAALLNPNLKLCIQPPNT